jgi:hypothetical protein
VFFLNFGLVQFVMLAGAASLATVALYLLDRSRRRQLVSTLRFWTQARQPVQTSRRRKLQQPWSLVLQLIGILLLLLAMAQPRIGEAFAKPGYHVLVLETSAWMGARVGDGTLMDRARSRANQWLATVPLNDPVMLLRADALATPATSFESDHRRISAAIAASEAGATSLDIEGAIAFARRAQSLQDVHGEIAFIGSGRVKETKDALAIDGRGLRAILIPDAIPNLGLRRVNTKRSAADQTQWDVLVTLRNYGLQPRVANLIAGFNQSPIGARRLVLAPGVDQEASFTFHSLNGGVLEARLSPGDAFPQDDRATLAIPALPAFSVTVYTSRPQVLRPFFAANSRVEAQFRTPEQYRGNDKGLVVFDRFSPATRPQQDAIWIDPHAGESPIAIANTVHAPSELRWNSNSPLGAGLRAHDTKVTSASVLRAATDDIQAASIHDGPVVVARPGAHKIVVIGFDPGDAAVRYELSTPLAFANILQWINPESFTQTDVNVQPAGSVSAGIENGAAAEQLQVTRNDGAAVPFTVDRHTLHFFSGARQNVTVGSQNRKSVYAMTLPEMWDVKWQPPDSVLRGIPRRGAFTPARSEIWPWLAVLGALCLAADWILFSSFRKARARAVPISTPMRRAS